MRKGNFQKRAGEGGPADMLGDGSDFNGWQIVQQFIDPSRSGVIGRQGDGLALAAIASQPVMSALAALARCGNSWTMVAALMKSPEAVRRYSMMRPSSAGSSVEPLRA